MYVDKIFIQIGYYTDCIIYQCFVFAYSNEQPTIQYLKNYSLVDD